MNNGLNLAPQENDKALIDVLDHLLESDQDITARAVARIHPSIRAASSITRIPIRRQLLEQYQQEQAKLRTWRDRTSKQSKVYIAAMLAEKDRKISELERQLELLLISHHAMIRAVGELGGFKAWSKFFEPYFEIQQTLEKITRSSSDRGQSPHISQEKF